MRNSSGEPREARVGGRVTEGWDEEGIGSVIGIIIWYFSGAQYDSRFVVVLCPVAFWKVFRALVSCL